MIIVFSYTCLCRQGPLSLSLSLSLSLCFTRGSPLNNSTILYCFKFICVTCLGFTCQLIGSV